MTTDITSITIKVHQLSPRGEGYYDLEFPDVAIYLDQTDIYIGTNLTDRKSNELMLTPDETLSILKYLLHSESGEIEKDFSTRTWEIKAVKPILEQSSIDIHYLHKTELM